MLQQDVEPKCLTSRVRPIDHADIQRAAVGLRALYYLIAASKRLRADLSIQRQGIARRDIERAGVAALGKAVVPARGARQQRIAEVGADAPAVVDNIVFAGETHIVQIGIGVGDIVDATIGGQQIGRGDPAGLIGNVTAIQVQFGAAAHDDLGTVEVDGAAIGHQLVDGARYIVDIAGKIEDRAAYPGEAVDRGTALGAVYREVFGMVEEAIAQQGRVGQLVLAHQWNGDQ